MPENKPGNAQLHYEQGQDMPARGMVTDAGSINRDHVQVLLSIPPNLSVSRAVQYPKGRSSQELLSEFASRRKRYWGQYLCARGYWVMSIGKVTDEA